MNIHYQAQKYLLNGGFLLLFKAVSILSTFGTLYLLTQMLDKENFAAFMVALTFVTLVYALLASPFTGIILYRVSGEKDIQLQREIFLQASFLCIAVSGLVFIFIYFSLNVHGLLTNLQSFIFDTYSPLSSTSISGEKAEFNVLDIFKIEGIEAYLVPLLLLILTEPFRLCYAQYLCSRKHLVKFVIVQEMGPACLKLIGLTVLYIKNMEMQLVVWVYILSSLLFVILPAFFIVRNLIKPPYKLFQDVLTKSDLLWGIKSLGNNGVLQIMRHMDILIAGLLFSPLMTADYALASRLSKFLMVPIQLFSQILGPRLKTLNLSKKYNEMAAETRIVIYFGLGLNLVAVVFLFMYGEWALQIFGYGGGALYPLILLSCGIAVMVYPYFLSVYAYMTGAINTVLAASIIGAVIYLGFGLVGGRLFGPTGLAMALALSQLASLVFLLKRQSYRGCKIFSPRDMAIISLIFMGVGLIWSGLTV